MSILKDLQARNIRTIFSVSGNYPTFSLCPHLAERERKRESLFWCFILHRHYSHQRVPPLWPNLTLITSQSPHLQMLSYWRLGLQKYWRNTNIESVTLFFFRSFKSLPKFTPSLLRANLVNVKDRRKISWTPDWALKNLVSIYGTE